MQFIDHMNSLPSSYHMNVPYTSISIYGHNVCTCMQLEVNYVWHMYDTLCISEIIGYIDIIVINVCLLLRYSSSVYQGNKVSMAFGHLFTYMPIHM